MVRSGLLVKQESGDWMSPVNRALISKYDDDLDYFGDGNYYEFRYDPSFDGGERYEYTMINDKNDNVYNKEWLDIGFLSEEDFKL